MRDKITKTEAKKLCDESGFSMERLEHIFEITPNARSYTFSVENERQYAIKVLNVISNLKQNERTRVLQRAIKINKV